jgi:hypothetical protein
MFCALAFDKFRGKREGESNGGLWNTDFEMSKSVDFEDSPVLSAFSTEFTIEVGPELLQHISRRIKTELYAKL